MVLSQLYSRKRILSSTPTFRTQLLCLFQSFVQRTMNRRRSKCRSTTKKKRLLEHNRYFSLFQNYCRFRKKSLNADYSRLQLLFVTSFAILACFCKSSFCLSVHSFICTILYIHRIRNL